jgi:hypothetical protein
VPAVPVAPLGPAAPLGPLGPTPAPVALNTSTSSNSWLVVVASLESKLTLAPPDVSATPLLVPGKVNQPCTSPVISVTTHWFADDAEYV